MTMAASIKMWLHKTGRNPKGYGLPSLVVVLFFVSVVVTTIVNITTKQNQRARAEANYNIAKDHIDAVKATGLRGNDILPHVIDNDELEVEMSAGLTLNVDTGVGYSDALWASKVRGYINFPMEAGQISNISRDQMPRKYPERILRTGDRMATNLRSENINNVQQINTGQGQANFMRTNRMLGINSTFISADEMNSNRMTVSSVDTTGNMTGRNVTISGSMITNALDASSRTRVSGFLSAQDSRLDEAQVTQNFATDSLDDSDNLSFGVLNVNGLRTDLLRDVNGSDGSGLEQNAGDS